MFECECCGEKSLIWGSDYSAEDYGIEEGGGIISVFSCSNEECNVMIEKWHLWDDNEENDTYETVIINNEDEE